MKKIYISINGPIWRSVIGPWMDRNGIERELKKDLSEFRTDRTVIISRVYVELPDELATLFVLELGKYILRK